MNLKTENKKGVKLFLLETNLPENLLDKTLDQSPNQNLADNFVELKTAVFLETIQFPKQKKEVQIWIGQTFFGDLKISYQDSEFFEKYLLPQNQLERQKHNFKGVITSTLIAKNDQILSFATQNTSLHKDIDESGVCFRERLRKAGKLETGQSYEICEGCNQNNHSEILAIQKALQNHFEEDLKDSTAYLLGHYYSCSNCSKKLEEVGIKEIIVSKKWVKNYLEVG